MLLLLCVRKEKGKWWNAFDDDSPKKWHKKLLLEEKAPRMHSLPTSSVSLLRTLSFKPAAVNNTKKEFFFLLKGIGGVKRNIMRDILLQKNAFCFLCWHLIWKFYCKFSQANTTVCILAHISLHVWMFLPSKIIVAVAMPVPCCIIFSFLSIYCTSTTNANYYETSIHMKNVLKLKHRKTFLCVDCIFSISSFFPSNIIQYKYIFIYYLHAFFQQHDML